MHKQLLLLAVLTAAFPAHAAGDEIFKPSAPAQQQITQAERDDIIGQPGWWTMAKSVLSFGGPLALLIYSNRTLAKDRSARRKRVELQQSMYSAQSWKDLLPLADGSFPTAEVRQPRPASRPTTSGLITAAQTSFDKDILTTKGRRFWRAMSWISSVFAAVNGFGFATNLWGLSTGNRDPKALSTALALHKEGNDIISAVSIGNIAHRTNSQEMNDRWKENKRVDQIYKQIQASDAASVKAENSGDTIKPTRNDFKQELDLYASRIHANALKHLNENWLARGWRFWSGNDAPTRFFMRFKDFNTDPMFNASNDATSAD